MAAGVDEIGRAAVKISGSGQSPGRVGWEGFGNYGMAALCGSRLWSGLRRSSPWTQFWTRDIEDRMDFGLTLSRSEDTHGKCSSYRMKISMAEAVFLCKARSMYVDGGEVLENGRM